ncbi:MAG: glycosyltransferase [Butyricicoccaceae bacterium]
MDMSAVQNFNNNCTIIYNVEAYLDHTPCSVVNQTPKDIEIICVNDRSTDRSRAYIRSFSSRKMIESN